VNHFHLSPTQIGIPNDRPRYYSIAVLPFKEEYLDNNNNNINNNNNNINHDIVKWFTKQEFMDTTEQMNVMVRQSVPNFVHGMDPTTILPLSEYLDKENANQKKLIVPEKLIHSDSSWCFDIVTEKDSRSACFTSSYGRFIRGTGSIIYTGSKQFETLKLLPPEERTFDSNWSQGLDLVGNLRYFSGIEIGRLFGFPVDSSVDRSMSTGEKIATSFQFPPDCTERQQWKLLGNSINVHVAAKMVYIGLSVMLAGHKT
jgi:tRNA (cytosine38-C5)-methyltransferase